MNSTEQTEFSDAPVSKVASAFRKCIALAATLLLLQFVMTLVSRASDTVELASHFCMHSLILAIPVAFLAWLFRAKGSLWTCLGVIAGLSCIVQPWSLVSSGASTDRITKLPRQATVLSWNVLSSNHQFESVDAVIRSEAPDVLVLIEVRPGFLDELTSIDDMGYSQQLDRPGWRGGGIAVFSRIDGVKLEAMDFGYATYPVVVVKLPRSTEQPPVHLIAQHTFSPMPISRTPHRDNQLRKTIHYAIEHTESPTVVVGDLNVTPWAAIFGELVDAGFQDSRLGTGNCPSWPAGVGPLGIPIDHCLFRGECGISQRRVLSLAPGSDHRPIAFTLHY